MSLCESFTKLDFKEGEYISIIRDDGKQMDGRIIELTRHSLCFMSNGWDFKIPYAVIKHKL